MYNNYPIMEYTWQSGTAGATNLALTGTQTFLSVMAGKSLPIAGQILTVDWLTNTVGSLFITTSGTGFEIWRRNAPSGTSYQHSNPGEFNQITTGSIAGAFLTQFVTNEPLILNVAGAVNGQSGTVVIRYR